MANQFLYTVPYKELSKWYIELYLNRRLIKSTYECIQLGKIIFPYGKVVTKDNYNIEIPIVDKIRFSDGKVFFREKNETNMNVYYCENGDLLVSKINFHQGAIAINSFGLIACTTHYQPYKINTEIVIPEYLLLTLRSEYFIAFISGIKAQGIKNESGYDFIKELKIPIPPIEKQQELVDDYNSAIKYAEAIKQARLSAISDYFIKELLPYNYEVSSIKKLFGTISLKEIDRWDVWNQLTNVKSNKYHVVPFGRVIIGKPQYGANTPGVDKKCDFRYIRITDINENGTLNNDIVFPKDVEKQYILHEDDFLIARSGNTVGKTFLYKESFGDAIYAGYLVRYIINKQLANPEYLFFYSKTIMYQNWVKKNQRISGQPNINGQEYLAVPIILPDLGKQQEMVNMSKLIQQDVVSQVRQSEILVRQAKQNFENAIFN